MKKGERVLRREQASHHHECGNKRERERESNDPARLSDGGPAMMALKKGESKAREIERDKENERERQIERGDERLKRESKKKKGRYFRNKIYYLGLEHYYSTIINLRWYCNKVVNFFRIASLSNASFMGFDAKF